MKITHYGWANITLCLGIVMTVMGLQYHNLIGAFVASLGLSIAFGANEDMSVSRALGLTTRWVNRGNRSDRQ